MFLFPPVKELLRARYVHGQERARNFSSIAFVYEYIILNKAIKGGRKKDYFHMEEMKNSSLLLLKKCKTYDFWLGYMK